MKYTKRYSKIDRKYRYYLLNEDTNKIIKRVSKSDYENNSVSNLLFMINKSEINTFIIKKDKIKITDLYKICENNKELNKDIIYTYNPNFRQLLKCLNIIINNKCFTNCKFLIDYIYDIGYINTINRQIKGTSLILYILQQCLSSDFDELFIYLDKKHHNDCHVKNLCNTPAYYGNYYKLKTNKSKLYDYLKNTYNKGEDFIY